MRPRRVDVDDAVAADHDLRISPRLCVRAIYERSGSDNKRVCRYARGWRRGRIMRDAQAREAQGYGAEVSHGTHAETPVAAHMMPARGPFATHRRAHLRRPAGRASHCGGK